MKTRQSLSKITLPHDTFLQKLLGDNYKWWFLLRFRLKSRSVSSWDSVFFVIGHFLILAGTLLTWWLASGKIIDFNLREKFSYFIIGELFFSLTFTFAEFMGFEFLRGSHNADLLKPQDYIKMKFVSYYGEALLQNLTKFIILLIFVFILAQSRLISPNFYSFF